MHVGMQVDTGADILALFEDEDFSTILSDMHDLDDILKDPIFTRYIFILFIVIII